MATPAEQLQSLKTRAEAAGARRQAVQVKLEAARQQLAEARQEALQAFGTDDLAALKSLLDQQESANTRAISEFANAVAEFEKFLGRMEEAMANPQAMAELLTQLPELAPVDAPAPAAATAADLGVNEELI